MSVIKRRPLVPISHYLIVECFGVWSALRISLEISL
jgi:hypothetical protein